MKSVMLGRGCCGQAGRQDSRTSGAVDAAFDAAAAVLTSCSQLVLAPRVRCSCLLLLMLPCWSCGWFCCCCCRGGGRAGGPVAAALQAAFAFAFAFEQRPFALVVARFAVVEERSHGISLGRRAIDAQPAFRWGELVPDRRGLVLVPDAPRSQALRQRAPSRRTARRCKGNARGHRCERPSVSRQRARAGTGWPPLRARGGTELVLASLEPETVAAQEAGRAQ
jgi:hypothetical protein